MQSDLHLIASGGNDNIIGNLFVGCWLSLVSAKSSSLKRRKNRLHDKKRWCFMQESAFWTTACWPDKSVARAFSSHVAMAKRLRENEF